ncbi:hypothetical protein DUI87_31371 [Hirundo rustica rustica]|uniref:Uncharacterized protein n=1 Tax=Hirundo rustica rustica TaxID=333673 RepID=A0A3M0J0G0_HIRRU|nr:hypothetical protein DUI87_31371 [Hirundo rustica rustica]
MGGAVTVHHETTSQSHEASPGRDDLPTERPAAVQNQAATPCQHALSAERTAAEPGGGELLACCPATPGDSHEIVPICHETAPSSCQASGCCRASGNCQATSATPCSAAVTSDHACLSGHADPMVMEGPTVPTMPVQPFHLHTSEINVIPRSNGGSGDPGITTAATVSAPLLPEMEQPLGHTPIQDSIYTRKDTFAAIDSAWCCSFPFDPGEFGHLEEPKEPQPVSRHCSSERWMAWPRAALLSLRR